MFWAINILKEKNQKMSIRTRQSFFLNYSNSEDHVCLRFTPSFAEEKKETGWGPVCVADKGKLSPRLVAPRSVHQPKATNFIDNAYSQPKQHLLWKAAPGTLPQTLCDVLTQVSKTRHFQGRWRTPHLRTFATLWDKAHSPYERAHLSGERGAVIQLRINRKNQLSLPM